MSETSEPVLTATLAQPDLEAWGRRVGEALVDPGAGARPDRDGADGGGPRLTPPLTIVLRGPLGAGKSVLARAIARGAGVESPMPSPTYNLVFVYETPGITVFHLDLYRLRDPDEVWELGWQELGEGEQLVLIEWPERAEALLPPDRWEVRLSIPEDDDAASRRRVEVWAEGDAPSPAAFPLEGEGA